MEAWLNLLLSFVGGGAVGALVHIGWDWWTAKHQADAKEKATTDALIGEMQQCRALVTYNGALRDKPTAPFIRFPITIATRATFEERHDYPKLAKSLQSLEGYTIALSHVNQLMNLHELLWTSTEQPTGVSPGAVGRREELRHQIADICAGQERVEGVSPKGFEVLPPLINEVLSTLEKIRR